MINFIQVEKEVRALRRKVVAGEIDQQTFETRLLALIDYASDGCYWMFGHKTGQWYRHDGQQWLPDDPPLKSNSSNTFADGPFAIAWHKVDWLWFIISLLVLGLIAAVVLISTLI